MTAALIQRLAETAIAVRIKRAATEKQALSFKDVGTHLNNMALEHKTALIGAGLGGAYGLATARPGHTLEDMAYGTGIGGIGGYGAGALASHLAPGWSNTTEEQKLADAAAAKEKATAAANEKAVTPSPREMADNAYKYVTGLGDSDDPSAPSRADVGYSPEDLVRGGIDAAGAGAGYVAVTRAGSAAHSMDSTVPQDESSAKYLQQLGHPAAYQKGTKGKPGKPGFDGGIFIGNRQIQPGELVPPVNRRPWDWGQGDHPARMRAAPVATQRRIRGAGVLGALAGGYATDFAQHHLPGAFTKTVNRLSGPPRQAPGYDTSFGN